MALADNALTSIHVEPGIEGRRWERFLVNRSARLMAVGVGLSGLTTRACQLVDISKGGAAITLMTTIGLPDHYYLNIVGMSERIGCAEVYRRDNRVGVKFIKTIEEDFLSLIVRGDFFTK
jgi:hypothetical protein